MYCCVSATRLHDEPHRGSHCLELHSSGLSFCWLRLNTKDDATKPHRRSGTIYERLLPEWLGFSLICCFRLCDSNKMNDLGPWNCLWHHRYLGFDKRCKKIFGIQGMSCMSFFYFLIPMYDRRLWDAVKSAESRALTELWMKRKMFSTVLLV